MRLICGLTTAEIARAFLVSEKTMGQRIFRAKKTLSEAHVPFETPRGDELRRRVESVLSVVRAVAERRGLTTTGTLGVLERGAALGKINFRQALSQLEQTTFRLSPAVRAEFLKRKKPSPRPRRRPRQGIIVRTA